MTACLWRALSDMARLENTMQFGKYFRCSTQVMFPPSTWMDSSLGNLFSNILPSWLVFSPFIPVIEDLRGVWQAFVKVHFAKCLSFDQSTPTQKQLQISLWGQVSAWNCHFWCLLTFSFLIKEVQLNRESRFALCVTAEIFPFSFF